MKVTLGTTVLATGSLDASDPQPARLVGASGEAAVQIAERIRAANVLIYGRGNIRYADSVEVTYSYASAAAAQAAILTLRAAALAASGTLTYKVGATETTIANAFCRLAALVSWSGCGIVMRYEIIAQGV
jgi:hypothetical protein